MLFPVLQVPGSAGGLVVTVGQPRPIDRYEGPETDANRQTHHFCGLIRAGNGSLMALYGLVPDVAELFLEKRIGYRISTDGGRTWSEQRELDDAGNKGGTLADGTVLLPSFYSWWVNERELRMVVLRSADGGLTWDRDDDVRVRFPVNRALWPAGWAPGLASMYFWGNILPLDGAAAVGMMYGQFAGDEQWRSILIRTEDGGRSWEFLSCIAGDEPCDHAGFTEPTIARLAGGDLLCVMRTEYAEPRILTQCWSPDGGRTWTDPIPAPGIPGVGPADREYTTPDGVRAGFNAGNVSPMLALLENGVLALAYARPGIKVAFSRDGAGRSWDTIAEIVPRAAPYSYGRYDVTAGMPGLVPIGRDRLLLLYDVYTYAETPEAPRVNTVFVRTLIVRRSG